MTITRSPAGLTLAGMGESDLVLLLLLLAWRALGDRDTDAARDRDGERDMETSRRPAGESGLGERDLPRSDIACVLIGGRKEGAGRPDNRRWKNEETGSNSVARAISW